MGRSFLDVGSSVTSFVTSFDGSNGSTEDVVMVENPMPFVGSNGSTDENETETKPSAADMAYN